MFLEATALINTVSSGELCCKPEPLAQQHKLFMLPLLAIAGVRVNMGVKIYLTAPVALQDTFAVQYVVNASEDREIIPLSWVKHDFILHTL